MGRTGDIVAGTFVADAGSAVESTSAAQVRDQAPQFVPTVATRIPSGQGNERSPEASIADPHESASVADFSSEAPAETNGSQDDEWTDLGDTGSVISR